MCETSYSEELIDRLRETVSGYVSGKRLEHTFAVEEECRSLGGLFARFPLLFSGTDVLKLRTAALLHDITKQKTAEEQFALCARYAIPLTDADRLAPKVLHAKTAPFFAREYVNPVFGWNVADGEICEAIRTHTTGAADMSLMGKLLYLADYIEATRTYEDCILLRQTFYGAGADVYEDADRLSRHLDDVLILSFDITVRDLIDRGKTVDPDTDAARNMLIYRRTVRENGQSGK